MTDALDIRWRQRLDNYRKAMRRLKEAILVTAANPSGTLSDLAREGLIQRFEFSHELAWKLMKDYLENNGHTVIGSRDAVRKALSVGLIDDARWIESIKARNLTSHTYDEDTYNEVYDQIISVYYPLMDAFLAKMNAISGSDL